MADPMAASLHFLELFPECQAWDVRVLDQQKQQLCGGLNLATATVRRRLPEWLAFLPDCELHSAHRLES